jgi:hypothetical protein
MRWTGTIFQTETDQYLLGEVPGDLARAGIDQMQSLARGTGDRLVPLIIRVHLFGRPALHVLARVRTTEEESAHTENGSTI